VAYCGLLCCILSLSTKGIDKAYTKQLSEKVREEISKLALPQQEHLLIALRRFMFRYLFGYCFFFSFLLYLLFMWTNLLVFRFLSVEQIPAHAPLRHYVPNLLLWY
jgi:hypothetical protein